jgi:hypothetical protein
MVQGKMNRRDNNFPLDRLWRTPPQLPHSFLQVLASKRKQQSGRLMGYKYQPDMVQGKMNRRDNNFPLDRLWRTPPQLPNSSLQVLVGSTDCLQSG